MLAGLPYTEIAFDRNGVPVQRSDPFFPEDATDLVILAHGWRNDRDDALRLYEGILDGVSAASDGGMTGGGRRFAAVGVVWPSLRFRRDLSLVRDGPAAPVAAGSAAAARPTAEPDPDELSDAASELAGDLGIEPDAFAGMARAATGGGGAANRFLEAIRSAVSDDVRGDLGMEHRDLLKMSGGELVSRLSAGGEIADLGPVGTVGSGWTTGGGRPFVRDAWRRLSGGRAAIAEILNKATYYEMKARAGMVGAGLAAKLDARASDSVRVHLVGHSFGGRLVAAACARFEEVRPRSMCLLQAAFSHNGFGTGIGPSATVGAFRPVISRGRVSGPIMVTHTHNDMDVGILYALASAASWDNAASAGSGVHRIIGGPNDPYGGMGANGALALQTCEVVDHVASNGVAPELVDGMVNNVLADAIVQRHSDVANSDVARLVWAAMR